MNSVVSEIDTQPRKAQEMLINLSEILRTTLDSDFMESTTLREELEILQKYLSIEKMRYEDQLNFEIDLSDEDKTIRLPKLILQPLVENAIKHGFKGIQNSLKIKIELNETKEFLLVKNDGAALQTRISNGTGLKNVKERMKIFTGIENSFEIYQEENWIINQLRLK